MKLGTQIEQVKFINHKYDKRPSETADHQHSLHRITTLKNFKSIKNVIQSFFKTKTFMYFKNLKEMRWSPFSILKTLRVIRK